MLLPHAMVTNGSQGCWGLGSRTEGGCGGGGGGGGGGGSFPWHHLLLSLLGKILLTVGYSAKNEC